MRTITTHTVVKTFDELDDDAKQTVLEKYSDINAHFPWRDSTYEDAKEIGLEITSFDGSRHEIGGKFTEYADRVIEKIIAGHGESCETHAIATRTKLLLDAQKDILDGADCDTEESCNAYNAAEDAVEGIEEEFRREIKEEYLSMLRKEYKYITSEEAIIESIRANEYEFDENGDIAN